MMEALPVENHPRTLNNRGRDRTGSCKQKRELIMASYPGFDEEKVQQALQAASQHNETVGVATADGAPNILGGGEYAVLAECISVTVGNHKVCLNLPLGIGSVCIPIPISVPDGTAAEACLHICTTWGVPTGVKVTISVAGHTIVSKSFGKC